MTQTLERKLPKMGLYQAKVAKVQYTPDVTESYKGEAKTYDKLVLIYELVGTKDDNDGERDFGVFSFYNLSPNVHFEYDGERRLTKAGKMLQGIFGPVPCPLKTKEVDWEKLVGTYATVFVNHKPPTKDGKVYAEILAGSHKPPESAEFQEINSTRAEVIYK